MREGGGEIKEGSGMNKWVSDQGKESERGRERERALWIVSGLRHSVNRRCFCMRCQCTGLLQGIARSFASHIYRPCLPDQHQPPAASSSWLTKHLESKGVNKTCEPQGMHVAYKQIPATGMTRNAVTQENWEEESPLQYIYFFLAFVTGDTINSLNGFKPQKTVISFWDEHSISTAQLKLNQRGGEKTDTQKLFFIGFLVALVVSSSLWSLQQKTAEEQKRQSSCMQTGELALPTISLKATWILPFSGSFTWKELRHCKAAKDLVSTEKRKGGGGCVPQWGLFQIRT